MFPAWRMKIRAAQVALKEGRCDEASALLSRESVRGFLPAKRLSHEVASHLVDRAGRKLAVGDSVAGWHDIQQALKLGGSEELVNRFREEQARLGLEQTRRLLERGETALAERQIAKLEQRRLGGDERRRWKLVVHLISQAKERAHVGDFTAASEMLERATRLLPTENDPLAVEIAARQKQLLQTAEKLRPLSTALHAAVCTEDWTTVLTHADALLELALAYPPALEARRRAWQAVGMKSPIKPLAQFTPDRRQQRPVFATTIAWQKNGTSDTMTTEQNRGKRLIAWIDEVGGFLVCLGNEVVIGQPTPGSEIDIPVRADLSRRHATIRREGESYILTPIHNAKVDGQTVVGPTLLRDNSLVELGDSLKLRFTKPHTLSATAVLKIESKHKTEPAVDAVVLMSESCVLGPRVHSHICCSGWTSDLVLFRRGEEVQFRSQEILEIDDHLGCTSGIITANCRLTGEELALSFEEV
ncbi:MAG: FHA domain-containing protein [Bythopirellula sp.]|nr:FHA domain-containing protein [Bythopirellula sp.]